MRSERDKIQGPCVVNDDLDLHGMVVGDARVAPGVRLELHGTVTGNLTIDQGGIANIHGMVTGSVYNAGSMYLAGMVQGRIDVQPGADTTIVPGSYINGIRQ